MIAETIILILVVIAGTMLICKKINDLVAEQNHNHEIVVGEIEKAFAELSKSLDAIEMKIANMNLSQMVQSKEDAQRAEELRNKLRELREKNRLARESENVNG